MLLTDLVISILLPFSFGIRGPFKYIAVAMLAFFPVSFLSTFLTRRIYPPRFEPYEPADMSLRQITKNHP